MDGCVPCVCFMPAEVRRGHQIQWKWSYRELQATMLVLGINVRSCGRASNTLELLNYLSQSPFFLFLCVNLQRSEKNFRCPEVGVIEDCMLRASLWKNTTHT